MTFQKPFELPVPLCTSGLHRVLGAEPIRCTLAARPNVDGAAAVVGRALHSGGSDNMTVVVVRPTSQHRGPTTGAIEAPHTGESTAVADDDKAADSSQ